MGPYGFFPVPEELEPMPWNPKPWKPSHGSPCHMEPQLASPREAGTHAILLGTYPAHLKPAYWVASSCKQSPDGAQTWPVQKEAGTGQVSAKQAGCSSRSSSPHTGNHDAQPVCMCTCVCSVPTSRGWLPLLASLTMRPGTCTHSPHLC